MVRRLLLVVVVALAVAGVGGPAVAAWVVGSSGATADARGTSVAAPTGASSTVTGSSVSLTWAAPASGPAPTGYTVLRTAPTSAAVCVAIAATSCTDTGLTPTTTYTYAVTAAVGPWSGPALTATATTATPSPSAFVVTVPATATAGTAFTISIQARKSDGTNDTAYTGSHVLTFSGPGAVGGNAPSYPASVTFTNGLAAGVPVTLYKAELVTITASDGDPQRTGVSGSVAVAAAAQTRMRWTTDAAGLVDACPSGSVVVGPNAQRSWYVAVLDGYGNRTVQGAARTVTIARTGGNGNNPTATALSVAAGANPAVTTGTTTMKLKKKSPTATTYRASSTGLANLTCTLQP